MDKINLNDFLVAQEGYKSCKAALEKFESNQNKKLSKLRKDLDKQNWMSKKHNLLHFSIYEYGEDYDKQWQKLDFLREELKQHQGEYIQINEVENDFDDRGTSHNESLIGIIDKNALSIKRVKNKYPIFSNPNNHFLVFNLEGGYIFYEEERLVCSRRTGVKTRGGVLRLIEENARFSSQSFENTDIFPIKSEKNTIYIGNDLFPQMIKNYGIEYNGEIPDIKKLYGFLSENTKGLRQKEQPEEEIIKLCKVKK